MSQDKLSIATAVAVGIAVGRWISCVTRRRGSNGDAAGAVGDATISRWQGGPSVARTPELPEPVPAQKRPTKASRPLVDETCSAVADQNIWMLDAAPGEIPSQAQRRLAHPRTPSNNCTLKLQPLTTTSGQCR